MILDQSKRAFLFKTMAVATAIVLSKTALATGSTIKENSTEHQIVITSFKFEPETLEIKTGDTITWINKDIAPHTATASDKSWDTGIIKFNQSKSITFDKQPTTSYFCLYHPMMKAKLNITVKE